MLIIITCSLNILKIQMYNTRIMKHLKYIMFRSVPLKGRKTLDGNTHVFTLKLWFDMFLYVVSISLLYELDLFKIHIFLN